MVEQSAGMVSSRTRNGIKSIDKYAYNSSNNVNSIGQHQTNKRKINATDTTSEYFKSEKKIKIEPTSVGPDSHFSDTHIKDEPLEDTKRRILNHIDIEFDSSPNADLNTNPYLKPFDKDEFFKLHPTDEPGPPGWRTIYALVKEMRSYTIAPVDTMGCERIPESIKIEALDSDLKTEGKDSAAFIKQEANGITRNYESKGVSPEVYRFQLLVGLLLSSQTKDQVTSAAVESLRQGLNPDNTTGERGLTIGTVEATSEEKIDSLICKVGFHKRKAGYLKSIAPILRENYNGDIPDTIDGMVSLPGIGPKMAHLLIQRAWGKVEGIGVDVHVDRLSRLWKWTSSKKRGRDAGDTQKSRSSPEETRQQLEQWLPKDLWVDINPTLVGFGQTICPSRGTKCDQCLVARTNLCPGNKLKKSL